MGVPPGSAVDHENVASLTVYTACYGSYDVLHPAPDVPGVAFVAFTDDTTLTAPGWDVRVVERPESHPRMQAKWFKLQPHRCLPDAERTLWLDASHEIRYPGAVQEALNCVSPAHEIAAHHHPRGCVYAEAEASLQFEKYWWCAEQIKAQAEHYRQEGHPEMWGMWACGSLARVRSERMDAAMDDWWAENIRWTYQDQISFPVVMRRHGIKPVLFPHQQYTSPWFAIHSHLRTD